MKWIESHVDLAHHPKLKRLARRLEIGEPQAIGHLHLLWYFAARYAHDGNIAEYRFELGDALKWPGDPEPLLDALIDVGFIDELETGLWVHDWRDHAGKATAGGDYSTAGARGNHVRWHERRGITDPECEYCSSPRLAPDSPPDRNTNRTAQHSTAQDSTAQHKPNDQFDELAAMCQSVAEELATQRIADGYPVKSRRAFIAKLATSPEVENEARKRIGPAGGPLADLLPTLTRTIDEPERRAQ